MRSGVCGRWVGLFAAAAASAAAACPPLSPDWMAGGNPLHAPVKPAHCALVLQTPPDFGWPEQGRDTGYRLTLTYPGGRTRSVDTAVNGLLWNETLPAGEYVWSVALTGKGGGRTSAPRRFTVDPSATTFVVPPIQDLYKSAAAAPRPRAFPRGEERTELLAALQAERKAGFAQLLARVETARGEAVPPEPSVRTDTLPTDRERKAAMAAIQQLAIAETRRTQEAAFAWLATQRPELLAEARRRLVNLAAWDPAGSTGIKSQDLAHRYIAWTLALGYDWLYEGLEPAARTSLLAAVVARQAAMVELVAGARRSMAIAPYDSHGEVVLTSVATISALLAGDAPEAQQWFTETVPLHVRLLSPWGGEDGGYANGTSYAQWYVADALMQWDVLRWATGLDVRNKPWVRGLGRYFTYFLPPGTPVGAFGDGAEERRAENWARYGKAYAARVQDPLTDWYARQWFGEDASALMLLLAPRAAAAPEKPPAGTPNAVLFPSIGWAALHSELADRARVSVYFKSSPYGSFGHSHADQNSFTVNAQGRALAVDSGYYDYYNSPHWNRWYTQTVAHNAITFDGGRGQTNNTYASGKVAENRAASGAITGFTHRPDHDVVTGDATAAYGGALRKAVRSLVYLRPGTILVFDTLESAEPRQWEWNVHALRGMEVLGERRIALRNEEASLCIDMHASAPVAFTQSNVFPVPPEGAPRPLQAHGVFRSQARSATFNFLAVLSVGCAAVPGFSAQQTAGGEWTVSVDGRTIRFGGDRARVQ